MTALPVYPQFATGQEPELAALAADYRRVWFVTDPLWPTAATTSSWTDAWARPAARSQRPTLHGADDGGARISYASAGEQESGGTGESAIAPAALPPCSTRASCA